ncbi:MAG: WD40 repeat domain-containing protein [Sandaracinus sp.]|nr:WD40 repeat domain-containing protein [Myxococcales bacterium]MCB9600737.1 WD40 repeat domain-containing protein [Sandaracinus sp.]MCB9624286.1 WD40 repeat domain-containing protein [Sandaracinus sp.]MCB9631314.1 WD40 repeat domain-containing protein [Sandaracinus sp.]
MNGFRLTPMALLSKREGHVDSFEWSPCGRWLAESRRKRGIRLWSFDGTTPVAGPLVPVPGLGEGASSWGSLRWSPDGRGLSISAGQHVRVFDVDADGGLKERWAASCAPATRERTAWRPDGTALAMTSGDGVVLLDASSGERTFEFSFRLRKNELTCVLEWAPDNQRLAVGTSTGMFGVNVSTNAICLDVGARMVMGARWWSDDVVLFTIDDRLYAWNPRRQEGAGQAKLPEHAKSLTLSADRTLAAVMLHGRLIVLRTPTPTYGPEPATLQVVADVPLNDVKKPVGVWAEFHPSEPRLAVHTGSASAIQIYAWDPASLA